MKTHDRSLNWRRILRTMSFVVLSFSLLSGTIPAADEVIPHRQDKPPGPPLSPEEAVKKMTVPPGFRVELVAAEPDLVNPIAMTFDEKGRIWVTESIEYPRKSPGVGKDRVKILEDTDGDGRVDKVRTFLDGLNIPSGVAVGHGGVWIANSPDLLFVPDADRDGKPDGPAQVVVTGFGRTDTHELPNSLTWGPDGWLYGLNGVFNYSDVNYPKSNPNYNEDHPGWKFTCAMFRIHPRTREFQVFAEGTSNPWGIAINENGDFFISACVIDHLWHIVETAYYQRQGGPYPPHTWPMGSIVKHKHQKAAYCGITWFDSDAYPEPYRRKLYMGNIHGGCINVDTLARDGSTYAATPEPDFLTANDAWFMPVAQKTGPDGCLYILDWYDRYHCYQDANRDPAGIERLKGRLYRVRYVGEATASAATSPASVGRQPHESSTKQNAATNETTNSAGSRRPLAKPFDLGAESDEQLIEKLGHPNVWMRETAQRLLQERDSPELIQKLEKILNDNDASVMARRHALFGMAGNRRGDRYFGDALSIRRDADEAIRAWMARLTGNVLRPGDERFLQFGLYATDPSPAVRLQTAIAVMKIRESDNVLIGGLSTVQMQVLLMVLERAGEDRLTSHVVWQHLRGLLRDIGDDVDNAASFLTTAKEGKFLKHKPVRDLMPRVLDRILDRATDDPDAATIFFETFSEGEYQDETLARQFLSTMATRVQTGEMRGEALEAIRERIASRMKPMLQSDANHPLAFDAALLAVSWKDPSATDVIRKVGLSPKASRELRISALNALIAAKDDKALSTAAVMLGHLPGNTSELRGQVLASLGRLDDPTVATVVVAAYPTMEPDLQPKAVELLTQRAAWAKTLLAAIGEKKAPQTALNENQVRKLLALKDADLTRAVQQQWGTIREGRNPQREQIIAAMKSTLRKSSGDAFKGREVFKKVCGQCHKMYGEGAEVGPDITLNGRNNYDQLLSNVFDPSLVIGASYQARILVTTDGRVLTGLPIEESEQRVVLKVQGGKLETIPRSGIEELKISPLSMMPENLEKQLKPEELADLFAYITLDRPPEDKNARRLPGVYEVTPRQSNNPAEFNAILGEVAPGFSTTASGEGVLLLANHRGRDAVVRTHPPERGKPCILKGSFEIPEGRKTELLLSVSHDPRGDWQLVVKANGETLLDAPVGSKTTTDGWADRRIDLSRFAGKKVTLELLNQPSDWSYESAFWGRAAVLSE